MSSAGEVVYVLLRTAWFLQIFKVNLRYCAAVLVIGRITGLGRPSVRPSSVCPSVRLSVRPYELLIRKGKGAENQNVHNVIRV